MKIAAYTPCSGREAQPCISSTTALVIRETVSFADARAVHLGEVRADLPSR